MNVYDFDKTIYPADSASHFWQFCVRRHPAAFLSLFRAVPPALKLLKGEVARGELKQAMFSCLRSVSDPLGEVEAFWDAHIDRIYPWYLAQRRDDDLIISASPSFLISAACRRLGVRCLATEMDAATGRLLGPNCYGEEKPRRFLAAFGDAHIDGFYSDSFSDSPMMRLADRAYRIRKGKVIPVTSIPGKKGRALLPLRKIRKKGAEK